MAAILEPSPWMGPEDCPLCLAVVVAHYRPDVSAALRAFVRECRRSKALIDAPIHSEIEWNVLTRTIGDVYMDTLQQPLRIARPHDTVLCLRAPDLHARILDHLQQHPPRVVTPPSTPRLVRPSADVPAPTTSCHAGGGGCIIA